uniref:Wsv415-like protein n=1 Tax=Trachysalambria curvirostris majanivirus TaxID=2984281 RepID=A0A9C7EYX1_9VIRU|nr:MAG: wsv415-like protein [Trachysalambria curvirostris majanivirus]
MSYISLSLINTLYNKRIRSLLYNHLISLPLHIDKDQPLIYNKIGNDDMDNSLYNNNNNDNLTSYDILTIDPLCPPDSILIKISIVNNSLISEFGALLSDIQEEFITKNNNIIENEHIRQNLQPIDSKSFKLPLQKFTQLLYEKIFGSHLDKKKLTSALFDMNDIIVSIDDIMDSFFNFNSFSKCIIFILYTRLLLDCIGSLYRFRIEDIYTKEFINIKRECYITTSSKKCKKNNLRFSSMLIKPPYNTIERIINYIIDPIISQYQLDVRNDKKNMSLTDIIANASYKNNYQFKHIDDNKINEDLLYRQMPIPIDDYSTNVQMIKIRKEARIRTSNKQILFPISKENIILQFINLSNEAKVLLCLPYIFLNKDNGCLYGSSIIKDGQECTFIIVDFLPIDL